MKGPLVDVAWLQDHLDDPLLRIADVRSHGSTPLNEEAHAAGHIPGAVFFDMEGDLAGPGGGRHPLPGASEFAAVLGTRGIGSEHTVVVYDDTFGAAGCRLWWMLRSLGHDSVAVLDGGLQAWTAASNDLATEPVEWPAAQFLGSEWSGIIDGDELAARLGEVTLVDARSADRFRGENEVLDPVAGHIPTATNLPFTDNVDDNGFLVPLADLTDTYNELDGEVVAYCGSGVTACHTLLAMEIAGISGGKLYPGSWSDWITKPDRPQAVGSEPGTP